MLGRQAQAPRRCQIYFSRLTDDEGEACRLEAFFHGPERFRCACGLDNENRRGIKPERCKSWRIEFAGLACAVARDAPQDAGHPAIWVRGFELLYAAGAKTQGKAQAGGGAPCPCRAGFDFVHGGRIEPRRPYKGIGTRHTEPPWHGLV